MLRPLLILLLSMLIVDGADAKSYAFPAKSGSAARTVTIYSSIDIDLARPLIAGFQAAEPDIAVQYHDIQTLDLYDRIVRETAQGQTGDLALSSAMDLQMKLVNDGFAAPWQNRLADRLPGSARWRNEAFGVTFEAAAIVYNQSYFSELKPIRSRSDLIALLKTRRPDLYGRIATYDAERSGLGFLFLARDVQHYANIWQLYRLFGENGAKLYSNSQAMIDRVAKGRLVIGYNLLGSYASAHAARDERIGVLWPQDFTVMMSRVALIPRVAKRPDLGGRFLAYMLSDAGQSIISNAMHMNPLARSAQSRVGADLKLRRTTLRPIRVGPGLLVYLDQAKRRQLLKRWNGALAGGVELPR
ncbi:MAG: ABC transporter substrate-binding protein [Pseudomonadota bacterium]